MSQSNGATIATTRMVFIRHGETEWNASGRWQGHADVPLSAHGQRQAKALAQRLSMWQADALICSDLRRASETAAFIGQTMSLPLIPDVAWREWDVGQFSGLTKAEIVERFPQYSGVGFFDAPEGESISAFHFRIGRALAQLVSRFRGETVLVVTHGGVIRMVLAHVFDTPPESYLPFALRANTSITIVNADAHGYRLAVLNDSAHLESI